VNTQPPTPNPALVTQRAAQRLPRLALLLFCAAYVLPGVFGRDPWRNADVEAYGLMAAMAEGRSPWSNAMLAGLPADAAALPHWLGAAFITLLSPLVEPAVAARLPFALLLLAILALVWYACLHLGRTEAAQPVAFAFGGQAAPVDYARAMADASVLAMMAALGLLQLGHETTPELVQLFAVSLLLWGMAAAPQPGWRPALALLAAPPLLALSDAPSVALLLGGASLLLAARSGFAAVRHRVPVLIAAVLLAVTAAWAAGAFAWRLEAPSGWPDVWSSARLLLWFMWPLWPLALWTLWRWRRQLDKRHVSVPAAVAASGVLACLAMGGEDRALMLALPGMAVLAAFALPTMRRSATALIDWFSMVFFSLSALTIWVIYVAMQTGVPARTAANVTKLAPGFSPSFSALALVLALLATVAWIALVRWRTGRHREAVWKSLVIPAGGVALCWTLLMSLWLPLLDHARSPRGWVERLMTYVPADACVAWPGASAAQLAALEVFSPWRIDARPEALAAGSGCEWQLSSSRRPQRISDPAWQLVATVARPTDRRDLTFIWKRRTS
jgi:4-amino-4-deoxy-L-arabinose transferase-like glycosyltransferase